MNCNAKDCCYEQRAFSPSHCGDTQFPSTSLRKYHLLTNLLQHYPGEVHAIAGYDRDARSDPTFTTPCPTSHLTFPRRFPVLWDRLRRRLRLCRISTCSAPSNGRCGNSTLPWCSELTLMVYISWQRSVRRNSWGCRSMPICMIYGSKIPERHSTSPPSRSLGTPFCATLRGYYV